MWLCLVSLRGELTHRLWANCETVYIEHLPLSIFIYTLPIDEIYSRYFCLTPFVCEYNTGFTVLSSTSHWSEVWKAETCLHFLLTVYKKDKYRREGKGRLCCLGDRIDSIPFFSSYFTPRWFEEKDEENNATWRNKCFEQMDDQLVHTTPNHHLPKVAVLPKTFLQINLTAKWLVRHSSTSPNQQQWPMPSFLYVSFFRATH